jgi:hypothetical protein
MEEADEKAQENGPSTDITFGGIEGLSKWDDSV